MPSQEQSEQRKCRQCVMRQLCFHERENNEDHGGAGEKVVVDLVPLFP